MFLGIVLPGPLGSGVFFTLGQSLGNLGDLIGDADALVGQILEPFEIFHMLSDFLSFACGNVGIELLAFVKALQIEIGPKGN